MSVTGKKEATTAISDNSLSSLVLGRSGWIIEDDNFGIKQLQANFMNYQISSLSDCSSGKPYSTTLKLTGCEDDEFTCADGQCIDINLRCDQITDCRDESDEQECTLLRLKSGYNKMIPPFITVNCQ